MKIDKCLENFIESYDKEMMMFIEKLNNDRSLSLTDSKINLVNIKESFDTFNNYIKGYSAYKIENKNNSNESPQYAIKESVNKFIDNELFKSTDVRYDNINEYVQSYIEGVKETLDNIDGLKSLMMEAGVDLEYVGDLNEFVDNFIEKMNNNFNESMNKILQASGYFTHQSLFKPNKEKKEKPIFV